MIYYAQIKPPELIFCPRSTTKLLTNAKLDFRAKIRFFENANFLNIFRQKIV